MILENKKVAWIRSGAIGDLLVGLCSLSETRELFPNSEMMVVGPKFFTELLCPKTFAFVKTIAVTERKSTISRIFENYGETWHDTGVTTPVHEALRGFDAVVNTNIDSFRYGFAAIKAGVPIRIGSAPWTMAWVYTHCSPFFGKDPLIHEKDAPLLILELAKTGLQRFSKTIHQNRALLPEYIKKSKLVAKWKNEGLPSLKAFDPSRQKSLTGREPGTYILVNPTASRREKTWPTERVRALLDSLKKEFQDLGLIPIIIGAPNETDWLKEVALDDLQMVQPKNLSELQDIVFGARLLLTNASSMQFIAGTTKTPTLTIMGRAKPQIWGPVGAQDRYIRGKFESSNQDSKLTGVEEEVEFYKSLKVDEVRGSLLELLKLPNSKFEASHSLMTNLSLN